MREAAKVLFREFGATAWAVAHDVKMQVEFNPALVASYRLVGYESRLLESEDFNDDAGMRARSVPGIASRRSTS